MAAVSASIVAAWALCGGLGLLARPLACGIVWGALAVTGTCAHPKKADGPRAWCAFVLGLAVAVLAAASASEVVGLAGLACLLALLAWIEGDTLRRQLLSLAAQSIAVLVAYRFALGAIPLVWHASEALGSGLGALASAFWGLPVSVGATFAGLDHLVLMTALVVGWAVRIRRPRLRGVLCAVTAVMVGQALYLLCLSLATQLQAALPAAPTLPPTDSRYVPPDWFWGEATRSLLPWNLPAIAAIWHLGVVAAMLRWGHYRTDGQTADLDEKAPKWLLWAPIAAAAVLPVVCVFSPGKTSLRDKTVLVYDQGYLDWDVPVHGRYGANSAGSFGMLPRFVASLGGRLVRSTELSEGELAQADVLLLLHPNRPWPEDRLARLHAYVRGGGSMLVAADPRFQDARGKSSYNEVLEPLGVAVCFDTTLSATASWRHGLHRAAHPATLGLDDDRNRFGIDVAASLRLPWRAAPLLVGRWGWSDPGSDFILTERARWDAGERLGDLVLAGECRAGSGRVVVLGATDSLTNWGNVWAYRFTGRLLAYLARGGASPQAWWRQLAGLVLLVVLVGSWFRLGRLELMAASLLAMLVAVPIAESWTCRSREVLPDGRLQTPNNVAYLDASHLEAYSESPWSDDGIDGLALTLMRDGFLVLAADDLSAERLGRAALCVSIAPARSFSARQQQTLQQFVEEGGALIVMAGATDGRQADRVLEPFGMGIPSAYHRPGSKQEDAEPLGCLYRPYPQGRGTPASSQVVFYAAWPISVFGKAATAVSTTSANQPIVARANYGRGIVVAIGDTCFAMNKTLENADGGTLVGEHVNADFWRWLIGELPGRKPWKPPAYEWSDPDTQAGEDADAVEAAQP